MATARGDYPAARALHGQSLAIARRLNDPETLGTTTMNLGYLAMQEGEYETARTYHLESLAWRRQLGTSWDIAISLGNVGDIACLMGDYPQAESHYLEALSLCRAIGHQVGIAWSLYNLGYVKALQGDPAQAEAYLAQSMELAREPGNQVVIAPCLLGYAELWYVQGRAELAAHLLASIGQITAMRSAILPARQIKYNRTVAACRGQLDETTFNTAWERGCALTLEQALALAAPAPIAEPLAPSQTQTPAPVAPADNTGLTAREIEVLHLLAEGLSNEQIAERLVMSAFTVRAHLRAIYGKLGVTTRSAATRYATDHHLV